MFATLTPRRKAKAVVAVPPVKDFYFTRHRFSSLGARTVLELLQKYGLDATFLDFPLMGKHGRHADIPKEMAYLQPFILPGETGKLSYFTKFRLFGPSAEICAAMICDLRPDMCFLGCFAYSYGEELLDISKNIKRLLPDIPVMAGGAGVAANPRYFIRDDSIDFVLLGEAEVNLRPFLDAMIGGKPPLEEVPNLIWKHKGQIFKSPVAGHTVTGSIEPIISKVLENRHGTYFSTSLSRGCPNRCRFCSNGIMFGSDFRTVAIGGLLGELDKILTDKTTASTKVFINFEDDNLLLAPEFACAIMAEIGKRIPKVNFLAENGLDYRLLTPELADRLIALGMASFNLTLGSMSRYVLEEQNRPAPLSHFKSIVRYVSGRGIPVLSYFIAGLSGDSKQHVVDTLAFLYNLPTAVGISMYYAIPGIQGFENLERYDFLRPPLCNGSSAYPWNDSLTTREMVTAFRLSRYVNLVKSKIKSEGEWELLDKIRLERRLFTLVKNRRDTAIVEVPEYDREMVEMLLRKIAVQPEAGNIEFEK